MSRTLDPQLSFADLELSRLGVHLDPVLQGIDAFLDRHSALVEHVRLDLERGLKKPSTGRNGITPSQALRSLTLMRQELGLSRIARAHQRRLHAARIYAV